MRDLLDATSWAVTEFADADLGDLRRTQRLVQLAHVLAQRPGAALPEACGSGAMLKAAYRFFTRLLLDSRVVDVPMSYNPIIVTSPSWNALSFNGLKR